MTVKIKDKDFPTQIEILQAICDHVKEYHRGQWPENDWFQVGPWDINIWTDDERPQEYVATAYPIINDKTITDLGITFLVPWSPARKPSFQEYGHLEAAYEDRMSGMEYE